jgi:uncharacterized phage protein (TIGR01671 family)
MIDLYKITPLILNESIDGLFIPFGEDYELMQFTGLLDKNGKEIYEGDIVKLGTIETEEEDRTTFTERILFDKGQFRTTHYGFPVHSWACNDKCFIEVIGNIYENPELLAQ